ncbi:MAG: glycoside hydrolase family 2 protein [marine benthic group bacterium]|nr:glycoside hydrolase family 2 protein [Gemmatimonadota bacterium]
MKRRDFVRHTTVAGTVLAVTPTFGHELRSGVRPALGRIDFNPGWQFLRGDAQGAHSPEFDDGSWSPATLPHTAHFEGLVTGEPGSDTFQWQGICWYRKTFPIDLAQAGQKVFLHFDGAMNVADVWLNGEFLGRHMGGWLPFGFDISDQVAVGRENVVAVRLDNHDNAITGPKPLPQLDFNPYHGLYRSVALVVKDPLHITDPILADLPASGGIFVTYPEVSAEAATVRTQVHVRNDGSTLREFRVRLRLTDDYGRDIAEVVSDVVRLSPGEDRAVKGDIVVYEPKLWSPRSPHLHTLNAELIEGGSVVDQESTRIGIRRLDLSPDGFRINGEGLFLRGTNRHQEYPYVGYALSDAAQYRDARKIKDAGFDYVRLSHYPHAPAFMDACDELGLVVMDCIPGWQFFNADDPKFTEIQYENCRRMIRRDRNHPCVILWEVSLNETQMPDEFIRRTHEIGHEEYPGDQCWTCGWTEGYDVFIQARQHGGCRGVTDRACVVSEYGDWEYYAQNAGLEQDAWADLAPDAANSRQLRWHGEAALLQQATNFQEAHNDNRKTIAFADGLWVMFDYNRGYAPDIESSGCMDLFRLPKFSRALFRSQRPADEHLWQAESGPMAFIASHWTPGSSPNVRVFSNCEEVGLVLNGELIDRRSPDADRLSTHLAHPPFTFQLKRFEPGTLEAIGYIGGQKAAHHVVRTPGVVRHLELSLDESWRPFAGEGKDVAFLRAMLLDDEGTLVADAWENVWFGATGDIELVGANPFSSDAGIGSILVQSEIANPRGTVYALSLVRLRDQIRLLAAAYAFRGAPEPFEIRATTDGSDPSTGAVHYDGSLIPADRVRAELSAGGRRLFAADTESPKFRIAGSKAPE